MSVADVRESLAAALATIPDLRASAYIADQINPPPGGGHAMFDYEIEPDLTFGRGADVYTFTVWVFANRTDEQGAQKFLDRLRDPSATTGVKYVIEHDSGFAADVDTARVTRIGKVEVAPVGPVEFLMVPFDVEVVF